MGSPGYLSKSVLGGLTLGLDAIRKQEQFYAWGSQSIPSTGRAGKSQAKAGIGKNAPGPQFICKRRGCLIFVGCMVTLRLSVLWQNYDMVLCVSFHHGLWVTVSNVSVWCDCLCPSFQEQTLWPRCECQVSSWQLQGPPISVQQAPKCQELLFS